MVEWEVLGRVFIISPRRNKSRPQSNTATLELSKLALRNSFSATTFPKFAEGNAADRSAPGKHDGAI